VSLHARPGGAGIDIGAFEHGPLLPAVKVQFESHDVIGYEYIGMSEIVVTHTGDTEGAVAVEIFSSAGTATVGSDYSDVGGVLVFQPGQTRQTFRVFVSDDSDIEERETVHLSMRVVGDPTGLFPTDQVNDPSGLLPISQVGGQTGLLSTDQATLHIVSDDAWLPGSLQFDTSSASFNEADGTATIMVSRVGGTSGNVSVSFSSDVFTPPRQATWDKRHTELLYPNDRDTPATAGEDYVAVQGTLNFVDGEASKAITIPLLDDAWFESGEAFVVRLSNPANGATLGTKSQIKVHIDSDDAKQAGTFEFASATYSVTEGTPFVNVTVDRVGGSNVEASVSLYHTGAGNGSTTSSAWWPSEYGSLPGVLTFAAGETSKTISIPIIDDSNTEVDEAFSTELHRATNDATVGLTAKTIVTIHDNESTSSFLFVERKGHLIKHWLRFVFGRVRDLDFKLKTEAFWKARQVDRRWLLLDLFGEARCVVVCFFDDLPVAPVINGTIA
jgi:hypothetical protein